MTITQAIIMTITPVLFVAIGLAMIYLAKGQSSKEKETSERE